MKIYNPANAIISIAESTVFSGVAPLAYTDLDLSAWVGATRAFVILWFDLVTPGTDAFLRKNGSVYGSVQSGICQATGNPTIFAMLTDDVGIVEWYASVAEVATIILLGFIK